MGSNLFTVHTKVLNFVKRNGLILGDGIIWRLVSLWVRPERTDVNFTSRHSPSWVNNNSQEGLLKLLVQHLS